MLKIPRSHLPIYFTLFCIFLFGIFLRHKNIEGANIVFDYDQIEDQFNTYKIAVDHDLAIIGRAIYGDPRLHHGVFYYYYNLIPFLVSSGNFFVSVYWNIFFNAATLFVLFTLAKSIFNSVFPSLISAFIVASSFEFIKFSSWLTIDTVAIFVTPLFYLGLWKYHQNKKWGLVLAFVSLGFSIQTDLSFLYLIPILLIFWIIFKPKIPDIKLTLIALASFVAAISTMILTEIKLDFVGIKTLLNFADTFEGGKLSYTDRLHLFSEDFWINFSNNLFPQRPDLGIYLGLSVILLTLLPLLFKKTLREEKHGILFLFLYLFAPAVTLILGYHDKPWFLIGLPPAIALVSGYAISRLRYAFLILPVIVIIGAGNINFIINRPQEAYKLFDSIYDLTSYLSYQLEVVDYTYRESFGEPFAINAVTYPLYYNGMWAYLYSWYGRSKYGYTPSWLGGDQIYPYDLLPKAKSQEKYFFMLISETPRIPEIYRNLGKNWAEGNGELVEEKIFNGFTVQKRQCMN